MLIPFAKQEFWCAFAAIPEDVTFGFVFFCYVWSIGWSFLVGETVRKPFAQMVFVVLVVALLVLAVSPRSCLAMTLGVVIHCSLIL
ncbi:hypothetical protein B0T24DRAFT_606930 [Lasiosphaeria ovina]|uniref:Uncharacterized protein n=1 Tax=Lasiosphaeria ovina TaxID=92902 RepID=A0AAE0TY98_9PEZI|nr:hypothetical protein B0T24DRAFT_606930 [Lasiosphaeria ovina]